MAETKQSAVSTQPSAAIERRRCVIVADPETAARIMLAFRRASALLDTLDGFSEKVLARISEKDPDSGQLIEEIVLELVKTYTTLYPSIKDVRHDQQIFDDVKVDPKAVQ